MNDITNSDDSNVPLFDLRQYFAKIVGEHLVEIAVLRKERNYSEWFKMLECLHTEISQKLDKDEEKEYLEVLCNTTKILNEHKAIFQGASKDNDGNNKVFNAINNMDMWLRRKMEENGIFGRKWDDEGL